jgi:small subunit ribosomal protein S20
VKARLRTLVKKVRTALDKKDATGAAAGLADAIQALASAVSKGVLHRNNASRRISRLSRQVAALRQSA